LSARRVAITVPSEILGNSVPWLTEFAWCPDNFRVSITIRIFRGEPMASVESAHHVKT